MVERLTWDEKEKIFNEVRLVYDVYSIKKLANALGFVLDDDDAQKAAKVFRNEYESDEGELQQMRRVIKRFAEEYGLSCSFKK